jgi:hypothetical protein
MRFQVLTVTSIKVAVFWNVVSHTLVETDRCFRGEVFTAPIIKVCLSFYQTTWHNIPEDSNLQIKLPPSLAQNIPQMTDRYSTSHDIPLWNLKFHKQNSLSAANSIQLFPNLYLMWINAFGCWHHTEGGLLLYTVSAPKSRIHINNESLPKIKIS